MQHARAGVRQQLAEAQSARLLLPLSNAFHHRMADSLEPGLTWHGIIV